MKHFLLKTFILGMGIGLVNYTQAQITITLQPDAAAGKDALLHGLNTQVNTNFGNDEQLLCNTFTYSGVEGTVRSAIEFDLSAVPNNSIVHSATLSLYAWDQPQGGSGQHHGSNAAWLERITTSWNENTVTWNNQPSTTTQNRVAIPATSSPTQSFPNLDVTQLVQDMVNNSSSSFGFMLKQQSETVLRRMNFCSSDHPNSALRPKLVVVYTPIAVKCVTLQPGPADGKDALIHGLNTQVNVNYGNDEQLLCNTFTYSGVEGTVRSAIEFDLSAVPANATLSSAKLSLYAWDQPQGGSGQHHGSNAAWLERITTSWNESTVTWNNQPSSTTQNRVAIPATSSPTQSFPNLDVTQLVQDMVNNSGSSFGFMLKQQSETVLRRMNFCSSDHPNSALRPKLEVCYMDNSSVNENESHPEMMVFPNPAKDYVYFKNIGTPSKTSILLININGQVVRSVNNASDNAMINIEGLHPGCYFYVIDAGQKTARSGKIIIQ